MSKGLQFVLCVTTVAAFGSLDLAVAQQIGLQAPDHSRQVYMANNCHLCHGTVGQGGAGPTLAPPKLRPENIFSAYVRHPTGGMPAYTPGVLNDADLRAIYGYLQSLPLPPPQLPKLLSEGFATDGH
jgi:mono/diheme cytochrome c family protein